MHTKGLLELQDSLEKTDKMANLELQDHQVNLLHNKGCFHGILLSCFIFEQKKVLLAKTDKTEKTERMVKMAKMVNRDHLVHLVRIDKNKENR